MELIKVQDYEELSKTAANLIIKQVVMEPFSVLGLATGGTPKGTYEQLIKDYYNNNTSYQNVTTINLDEYVGLSSQHPNSYQQYMYVQLFKHINIHKRNVHIPNGVAKNLVEECERYDHVIKRLDGIDLQLLGIGQNGHIGFNEPGTSFRSFTHVVKLTESTRVANAKYFKSIEEVPTHAITMGIASILKSKKIMLLVSGKSKAEALKQLLTGEISEQFPASILNTHPNVTVFADEAALR